MKSDDVRRTRPGTVHQPWLMEGPVPTEYFQTCFMHGSGL